MPEAPSGEVYFYNYKEPLMKFEGGYGFVGALIYDAKSDQIQCHYCGEWFDILQHHLKKEHNMSVPQYKEKVGLNKKTALISENFRAILIRSGLKTRIKNLRRNTHHTKASRLKISNSLKLNMMEKRNGTNTCPEQLLERLVKRYNELGRTPLVHSRSGELTFRDSLIKVFGSMKKACKLAGIPYRKTSQNRDQVDFSAHYDNAALLDFLRMFEKNNKRKPSQSDARRGLIPSASRYVRRFGSWKKALDYAFPD